MKFTDTCCNCNEKPRGYADLFCGECRRALSQVQERLAPNVTLDEHIEGCRYCRQDPRNMCAIGSRLYAEAISLDGRLDKEYAQTFGASDPSVWFLLNG